LCGVCLAVWMMRIRWESIHGAWLVILIHSFRL